MAKNPAPALHYDKESLIAEYRKTFTVFIAALFIGVAGALLYFFVFVVYLGGTGHTPPGDFARDFGSRIEYEYDGLKSPLFGGPAQPEEPAH